MRSYYLSVRAKLAMFVHEDKLVHCPICVAVPLRLQSVIVLAKCAYDCSVWNCMGVMSVVCLKAIHQDTGILSTCGSYD